MTDVSTPLEEARQGVWCPKLCTHACPVSAATGHQVAVPWAFHRAVVDLDTGRLPVAEVADRLHECSGCLGCRDACTFAQDVPAQVREARATAPIHTPTALAALDELRAALAAASDPVPVGGASGQVALLAGCHDDPDDVAAAARLLAVDGHDVVVVTPPGCCGASARDLGAVDLADDLGTWTAAAVGDAPVVAISPHCEVPGVDVVPALTVLGEHLDDLDVTGAAGGAFVVHDPCLSARRDDTGDVARALLAAAGVDVREPEGSGTDTVCSGAGLSLPLVDPDVAGAVSDRRVAMLGDAPVVTWCGNAARRLRASGADVTSLWQVLDGTETT